MEPFATVQTPREIAARVSRRSAFIGAVLAFNLACWWAFLTALGIGGAWLSGALGITPADWPVASLADAPVNWILGLLVLLHLAILAAGIAAVVSLHQGVRSQARARATR